MSAPRPRFPFDRRLLVICAPGLRPSDLGRAPTLLALGSEGRMGPLETIVPAVTSSVQASVLTGRLPRDHGIVGNGWYFRDLAQIWFWRQSNHLIQAPCIYDLGLGRRADFRCAKMFWWFNMYGSPALSVTPRPQYFANGLKLPGLYSHPPALAAQLQRDLGEFPLFKFWGPGANIESSAWIAEASRRVLVAEEPDLALVYLPHLDYDHQRFGPDDPRSQQAVLDLDRAAEPLISKARELGYGVVVFSEYGIEAADRPVFLNRELRRRGFLEVQETRHGELLDAGASRSFAVVDHQIAHVYVAKDSDLGQVRTQLEEIEGVARVLDRDQQRELGLDHERSGELVVLAEREHWFAYHYWLDEARRPDFAATVDIHRKPGYDPAELFIDPALVFPKLRIAWTLLKKMLGFRYLMEVIPTNPAMVKGSHGLLPSRPELGPVFVASPGLEIPENPRVDQLLFETE